MNRQHEVMKLKEMIYEEEFKLKSARSAFQEETQRFNTLLFESQQVSEKLESQNKECAETKNKLDKHIRNLKTKIEDKQADINFKSEENDKYKD
jgi:phosphate uptake regulator